MPCPWGCQHRSFVVRAKENQGSQKKKGRLNREKEKYRHKPTSGCASLWEEARRSTTGKQEKKKKVNSGYNKQPWKKKANRPFPKGVFFAKAGPNIMGPSGGVSTRGDKPFFDDEREVRSLETHALNAKLERGFLERLGLPCGGKTPTPVAPNNRKIKGAAPETTKNKS